MKGSVYERSLKFHESHQGKIEIRSKVSVKTNEDMSLAYTPGVAEPCLRIQKNRGIYIVYFKRKLRSCGKRWNKRAWSWRHRAHASMPVMEGKALIFKLFVA